MNRRRIGQGAGDDDEEVGQGIWSMRWEWETVV